MASAARTFFTVRSSKNLRMTFHAMEKMPGALITNVLYICSAHRTNTAKTGELRQRAKPRASRGRTRVAQLVHAAHGLHVVQDGGGDLGSSARL